MAYIGRLSAVWLGKETTPWTAVEPQVWIPKESGVLNPTFEESTDNSGYWVIDEVYDTFTTKNSSNITLGGIVRDSFIGFLLLWALGKYTKLYCISWTVTWWTPQRWDIETSEQAVLKKILKIWDTTYYFFDKDITWTITNWTWTIVWTQVNGVNAHFFEKLNATPSF